MQHTTLPEHAVARFTRQVLETLEYLQNWYGIAHLDIKLDNLLCSSTNVSTADIKLADFGFAQILRESANTVPESNSADDADVACGATLDQCLVSPKGVCRSLLCVGSAGESVELPKGLGKSLRTTVVVDHVLTRRPRTVAGG